MVSRGGSSLHLGENCWRWSMASRLLPLIKGSLFLYVEVYFWFGVLGNTTSFAFIFYQGDLRSPRRNSVVQVSSDGGGE